MERLGKRISVQGYAFRESFQMGRVRVSLHSAGHILGSAQVRLQHDNEVWVVSGDYKRERDPSCDPFEVVYCDVFITEATFGTPRYVWSKLPDHGRDIYEWWNIMSSLGKNAVIFGYSLGKAQRILAELYPYARKPVLLHRTMAGLTDCYRAEGKLLAPTVDLENALDESEHRLTGELILAPPSAVHQEFAQRLGSFESAFASGWMLSSLSQSSSRYDRGFVISDHADWDDLNRTICETGAQRVFVQHRKGALIRHLRQQGIDAHSEDFLIPEKYKRLGGRALSLW